METLERANPSQGCIDLRRGPRPELERMGNKKGIARRVGGKTKDATEAK